jgi:hypothetical protein
MRFSFEVSSNITVKKSLRPYRYVKLESFDPIGKPESEKGVENVIE